MVLGGEYFDRWLGHEGSCFMNGISALIKETPERSFALPIIWEYRKIVSLEPGRLFSPDPNSDDTLIFYFQLPKYENTFVVNELPRLYFVIAAGIG